MKIVTLRAFDDWFDGLRDEAGKNRIRLAIGRLARGNPGDVRPVGDGVSEMRIHTGPGYRVYFIQKGPVLAILLAGGDKSSQKRDILKAKQLAGHTQQGSAEWKS